jgi:hypothetical protein
VNAENGRVDDLKMSDERVHFRVICLTHCCQIQVIKHCAARAPHARVAVLLHALVVEAVYLRDLSRLVVSSQERDAVRVAGVSAFALGQGQTRERPTHRALYANNSDSVSSE